MEVVLTIVLGMIILGAIVYSNTSHKEETKYSIEIELNRTKEEKLAEYKKKVYNKNKIFNVYAEYGQPDVITKLLMLVDKKKYVYVDVHTDCQLSKNKAGWYLNSQQFQDEFNQDNKYIAVVDFFDNEKRGGDVEKIVVKLTSTILGS